MLVSGEDGGFGVFSGGGMIVAGNGVYTSFRIFLTTLPSGIRLSDLWRMTTIIYISKGLIKNTAKNRSAIVRHWHGYSRIDISLVPGWYGGFGKFVAGMAIRELVTSEQLAMPFTNVRK
jgi:hypothetical protein